VRHGNGITCERSRDAMPIELPWWNPKDLWWVCHVRRWKSSSVQRLALWIGKLCWKRGIGVAACIDDS